MLLAFVWMGLRGNPKLLGLPQRQLLRYFRESDGAYQWLNVLRDAGVGLVLLSLAFWLFAR